jgi:hypothetical protein
MMRRLLTFVTLLSPALLGAATYDVKNVKIPATSLLPSGSELKGVMLPRYDENHRQIGLLKVELMKIIDADQIDGKTISIELFNPDKSPRASINLVQATLYQKKELIVAKEPVTLRSELMTTCGSGLCYSFTGGSGKGFISGPVTTTLQLPLKKP